MSEGTHFVFGSMGGCLAGVCMGSGEISCNRHAASVFCFSLSCKGGS